MKKRIAIAYLIGVHLLLAVVLLKNDFVPHVLYKLGIQHRASTPGWNSEITEHFDRMLRYHRRMDGNVPDGAVVFIGDSITQGLCVSAVASPSVNYGIGSDTTVGVLQRLPVYKSIARASGVVLAIGVNDMKYRLNGDILRNYSAIIERIPDAVPVIISAVLPLNDDARQSTVQNSQGPTKTRIFELNSALQRLTRVHGLLRFVDVGPFLADSTGNLARRFDDGDGVHLNSEGNAIWIGHLQKAILEAQQTARAYALPRAAQP